jgi:preprotein translocase subunit YajC
VDADGASAATLMLVAGTFALDVFSTLNSSPQTTELFAGDRESSLMHWVVIGDAVAIAGGLAGTVVSGSAWPLLAAAAVALGMHFLYRHAVTRGTGEPAPANGY